MRFSLLCSDEPSSTFLFAGTSALNRSLTLHDKFRRQGTPCGAVRWLLLWSHKCNVKQYSNNP